METQLPRSLVLRAEAVAHDSGPEFPGGAELRNLLEEVAVRIEEEGDAWGEVVDVEPGIDAVLDVLNAVAQGEGQFLQRRRARLADVISADRHGVPARDFPGAEGK